VTAYKIEISESNITSIEAIQKAIKIAKSLNQDIKVVIKSADLMRDTVYEDVVIYARPDSSWLDLEEIYRLKFNNSKQNKI
jgi:hypothetical protein